MVKKHDWKRCGPDLDGTKAGIDFWGGVTVSRFCCDPHGKWAEIAVTSYREQLVIVITATGLMRVYRGGEELTCQTRSSQTET